MAEQAESGLSCPSCGSKDVVNDSHHSHDQLVCSQCGCILEQGSFLSANDASSIWAFQNNASDAMKRRTYVKVPEGKSAGISRIRHVASEFRLSTAITEEAIGMFERAYLLDSCIKVSVPNKVIIAAVCAYTTMRRHGCAITIHRVCNAVGCAVTSFSRFLTLVATDLDVRVATSDVDELLPRYAAAAGLARDEVERAHTLIAICREACLADGRPWEPIIVAVIYLVWQAAEFPRRASVPLRKFCEAHKLPCRIAMPRRIAELREALSTIYTRIPWRVEQECSLRRIVKHLADILQYWRHAQTSSGTSALLASVDDEQVLPPSARRLQREREPRDDDAVRLEWTFREEGGDSELTAADIPNEELHEYIRTPHEVALQEKIADMTGSLNVVRSEAKSEEGKRKRKRRKV